MSMKTVLMVILLFMAAMIGGCASSQQKPVWGKGDLPLDHQKFFGDDNPSRLNYVQNMVLDKHNTIIKEIARRVLAIEAVDPNAMRLETLESGMEKLTLVEAVE